MPEGPEVLRQPLPLGRSILWRPAADAGRSSPATDPIFVSQGAVAALREHAGTAPEKSLLGFLIGDLCECSDTATRYILIRSTIRATQPVLGDRTTIVIRALWDRVRAEVRDGESWLLGWYHTHPGLGIELSAYDVEAHARYFTEAWQAALVIGMVDGTPAAGWFRAGTDAAWPRSVLPFYEVSKDEPSGEAKMRSYVVWKNYRAYQATGDRGARAANPMRRDARRSAPHVTPPAETSSPSPPPAPRLPSPPPPPPPPAPPPPPPAGHRAPSAPPPIKEPEDLGELLLLSAAEEMLQALPPPEPPPPAPRAAPPPVAPPLRLDPPLAPAPPPPPPPPRAPPGSSVPGLVAEGAFATGQVEAPREPRRLDTPAPPEVRRPRPARRSAPQRAPRAPRRRSRGLVAVGVLLVAGAVGYWRLAPRPPGMAVTRPALRHRPTLIASARSPALARLDLLADSLALAMRRYDERASLFERRELDCLGLSRGVTAVEARGAAYREALGAEGATLDAARATRDHGLRASLDSVEQQFRRSQCPRS